MSAPGFRNHSPLLRGRGRGITVLVLAVLAFTASAQAQFTGQPGLWDEANNIPGQVYAMLQYDPDGAGPAPAWLIIAGHFSRAGGTLAVNNIVAWDGSTWHRLSSGLAGVTWGPYTKVYSLCVFDPDGHGPQLYAAGTFATAGGMTARGVARWDGSVWHGAGTGAGFDGSGVIYSLAACDVDGQGSRLYAAGDFGSIDGVAVPGSIVRLDPTGWHALPAPGPYVGWIRALVPYDADGPAGSGRETLVAAGYFCVTGCVDDAGSWNGSTWTAMKVLGYGAHDQPGDVLALCAFSPSGPSAQQTLYASVHNIDGGAAANGYSAFVRWISPFWYGDRGGAQGSIVSMHSLHSTYADLSGGNQPTWQMVTAGDFVIAATDATGNNFVANRVTRFDGSSHHPLGVGFDQGSAECSSTFASTASDAQLFVGGTFITTQTSVTLNGIARWDGPTQKWLPLCGDSDDSYSPIYVKHGSPATIDGTSWATAYPELRDALVAAQNSPCTHQIWVAAGTYTPDFPHGDRSKSFQLRNNLAIYGGFAGTESLLSQRNIPANATILSGDLNGDDVGNLNTADNSFHVVTVPSAHDAATRLDGFTIRAGNAAGAPTPSGGALLAQGGPGFTVVSCIFQDNQAVAGGALSCDSLAPVFNDCIFQNNLASDRGGAAAIGSAAGATFSRCSFLGNSSVPASTTGGGGAVIVGPGRLVCVGCDFVRNRSGFVGGGVRGVQGATGALVDCSFLGNSGANSGNAIDLSATGTFDVVQCRVVGNAPGALAAGPWAVAVYGASSARINIHNTCIVANAGSGPSASAGGGGFYYGSGATAFLYNSVIWGNRFSAANPPIQTQQFYNAIGSGSRLISFCLVEGWDGNLGGTTSSGLDPGFLRAPSPGPDGLWGTPDDDYGDLHFALNSPAIDSGDSTAVPPDTYDIDGDGNTTEALPLDLDGNPRFYDYALVSNTGNGSPPVDRGCYEFTPPDTSVPGDRRWVSPSGGSWDTLFNWYPGLPSQLDNALFDLPSTYTVSCTPPPTGLATRNIQAMRVSAGTLTLDLNQTSLGLTATQSESLIVGNTANAAAALTITDGVFSAVNARVGAVANNPGVSNTLTVGALGDVTIARSLAVGYEGNGRMNITSGGHVTCRDADIGDQPGSSGYVSVSGTSDGTASGTPSTWDIPFFCIVDNGELNVSNRGVVNVGTGVPFTGLFLLNDGRLSGDGTINGNVVNFGSISPGNSPGTLTINGGYAQVGQIQDLGVFSGSLNMEIAPPAQAGQSPQYDKLVVNGDASLGGGMFVRFINGFQPSPTDSFRLISTTGLIGDANHEHTQFDVIFFPAVAVGKYVRADYTGLRGPGGNGVTISVADLPVNAGFGSPQPVSLGSAPSAVALGDLNRDGFPDLVITLPAPGGNGGAPGSALIVFNDGSGNFGNAVQIPTGVNPMAVAIADFDGVQGNDIAIADSGGDDIRIIRQQAAAGSFNDPTPVLVALPAGAQPVAIAAVDLDAPLDVGHRVDLAVANQGGGGSPGTGSIAIARNIGGSGLFAPLSVRPVRPGQLPTDIRPIRPRPQKFSDIAVATVDRSSNGALLGTGGSVTVFVNGGGMALFENLPDAPTVVVPVAANPVQILSAPLGPRGADATTGQVDDLVTVNRDGQSVSVIRNTTTSSDIPSFAAAVDYPIDSGSPGTSSDPRSIALADLDDDDDFDLAVIASTGAASRVVKILRNDSRIQSVPGGGSISQVAFSLQPDQPSGDCPARLVVGEVNGDGRKDLVTVNENCLRATPGSFVVSRNSLPRLDQSRGACCGPANLGGVCTLVTVGSCATSGGVYRGDGTTCTPCLCPSTLVGACCLGATCVVTKTACQCTGPSRRFLGIGAACNAPANHTTPCCNADFNQSGQISVQDLFDFLAAYFGGQFDADFNRSQSISVQDIFDFLAAYFAGCF